MKFRYNAFNFSTAMVFVGAFMCLMLHYLTYFMFYPAMLLFAGGFGMLTAILVKYRKRHLEEIEQAQEVLVMERAVNDDGETFVMRDPSLDKKERKKRRRQKREQLLPIIGSGLASLVFLVLFVLKLF